MSVIIKKTVIRGQDNQPSPKYSMSPAYGGADTGSPPVGMKKGGKAKKWAQHAFKPSGKGKLHRALGIPEGQKIPASRLASATHSKNPHVRHMAQAAKNINK